jgi:hypothetical protein
MGNDTVAENAVGLIIPIPGPFYHAKLRPQCSSAGCWGCRRPWSAIRRRRVLIFACERCGCWFCVACWRRRVQTVAERVVLQVGTWKELAHVVILCAGCKQ